MFADDLFLFGEDTEKQMECVMKTLNLFCSMSEQEVSQEKTSLLFSKNVSRSMHNKLVYLSGYRVTSILGNHLGVTLSGKILRRNNFQYLVDRIIAKLNGWKRNNLSFAGRIILDNIAIQATPLYLTMTNRIPKSSIEEIHGMQRKFILGDTHDRRKMHAVGLDSLKKPKKHGGIGFGELGKFELSLSHEACFQFLGLVV